MSRFEPQLEFYIWNALRTGKDLSSPPPSETKDSSGGRGVTDSKAAKKGLEGKKFLGTRTYQCGKQSWEVKEYEDIFTGLEFVMLPEGIYMMGAPEGDPFASQFELGQVAVRVKPFLIAKYPITQRIWTQIMGKLPCHFQGENLAVENITWEEAREFCAKLDFELPTESQWEFACRGGTEHVFYWEGDYPGYYTWNRDNSEGTLHPVGQKSPNAYGLYDMCGSVWELCRRDREEDILELYEKEDRPKTDETFPFIVARGGSWMNSTHYIRSTSRIHFPAPCRSKCIGFRPVVNIED